MSGDFEIWGAIKKKATKLLLKIKGIGKQKQSEGSSHILLDDRGYNNENFDCI